VRGITKDFTHAKREEEEAVDSGEEDFIGNGEMNICHVFGKIIHF
jgi:hypothetical protein